MSQRSVEILLGKLVTDEEVRHRFRVDPEDVFATARSQGLEISAVEAEALRALDAGALEQLAGVLDPRLQKASLHSPPDRSGAGLQPRRARR